MSKLSHHYSPQRPEKYSKLKHTQTTQHYSHNIIETLTTQLI